MKPKKIVKQTSSNNEFSQPPESQFSYQPEDNIPGGESVRVALRLRPMNQTQTQRADSNCFKIIDECNTQLVQKNGQILKNFRFNYVLPQRTKQNEIYTTLRIDDYIESALNGYSVTIFAYGQTGSGKTYTMAGKQENYQQQVFKSDETDGIIPRAIKNLWYIIINERKYSQQKNEKFSIKASFTQIYNEQIKDLLNPTSGVLHCRWNPANGFFVEDLIIVDCTSVDDIIAVLNEGIKNRKSGSHQLNKDSSRSHSLMTIYMISQTQTNDNRSVKKYGKLTFVDLAGSQRLKQSKSAGQMAKQTANINKSLFTLGKVIKALSDRKVKVPYIPYRDSKLTMLLMDSLGGTSKALMVACASPASVYFDQTLSTLNYATRTMNIKNKPVVQMEEKDQIIYGLMRQRDLLRLQNQYLRSQIQKATKGKGFIPEVPKVQASKKNLPPLSKGAKTASNKPMSLQKTQNSQLLQRSSVKSISKNMKDSEYMKNNEKMPAQKSNRSPIYNVSQENKMQIEVSLQKIIQEYEFELSRLQTQNQQLRNARQVAQKNYMIVSNDNNALQIKLQNLEQLFIKNSTSGKKNINQQYMNCNLIAQNKMIKNKIIQIEDEIFQLKSNVQDKKMKQEKGYSFEQKEIKVMNRNLKERLQFLRKRQMELMALISKRK